MPSSIRAHFDAVFSPALKISKPLRYVFYRILSWKLKDVSEALPVLASAGILFVLLGANLVGAYFLVVNLTNRPGAWLTTMLENGSRGPDYVVTALAAFAFTRLVTYAWVDNGRLEKLIREFQSAPADQERRRTILFWGYVLFSIAFPIIVIEFTPRS
jgi:hypothetical protein